MALYTYGFHRVFPNRLPWLMKEGWYLVDHENLATEKQQKQLEFLGWGRDNVTYQGAEVLIQSILEAICES